MTIFVGAFQHVDVFHRIVTIVAASSILSLQFIFTCCRDFVIWAIKNPHFLELTDAKWYERISTITLVLAITALEQRPGGFPI